MSAKSKEREKRMRQSMNTQLTQNTAKFGHDHKDQSHTTSKASLKFHVGGSTPCSVDEQSLNTLGYSNYGG